MPFVAPFLAIDYLCRSVVYVNPSGGMSTSVDSPCRSFEPGSEAFYESLRRDDPRAWECLYLSTYRSFVPYARQRSAISEEDVLDLLQDGLAEFAVKLQSGAYAFQGKPVAAYVFTVCRNRWVSFLRKHRLPTVELSPNAPDDDESAEDFRPAFGRDEPDEEVPGTPLAPDPFRDEADVNWEAVGRAFAEVGTDCQAMLHCFYVEEKSLSECGARIGLQENSAKVKRFRCAQRLKTLYRQYERT
jgi:RNA polymerase sigma factor (sigma-70 family)